MSVQLLNTSERCVDEALEGLVAANPGLVLVPDQRMVLDRDRVVVGAKKKLAVVSGGGSGHEPFCAGYVGQGMLGGAVAGPVFTSPPPGLVTNVITALGKDNPEGVLVIVFNYTGDRVTFGLAVERCRAAGIKAEMYISGDDTALAQLEGTAGRRGLCGTLFVFKIAGAMADAGASLEETLSTCRRIGDALGTIGIAASGCTLPGSQAPLFNVPDGKLELGLGVHGEAGIEVVKAGSAKEVVERLLNHLTKSDSVTKLELQKGDDVAVIVNNLGCVSQLEMGVITREVVAQLKSRGVNPVRVYQGPLMTSLDMKGFHVSVLRLLDPRWISFLDQPTSAPAWPKTCVSKEHPTAKLNIPAPSLDLAQQLMTNCYTLNNDESNIFKGCLEAIVKKVPEHEEMLNLLDTGCGDGDCGSTLIAGITAMSKKLPELPFHQPSRVLAIIGDISTSSMGGTSGGLYSILFTAAANSMTSPASSHRETWAAALKAGIEAVSKYGGAKEGARTMLDALIPAQEALDKSKNDQSLKTLLKAVAEAADGGAKKTTQMKARAGRASYVRADNVTGEDAGARAVACVFQATKDYEIK